MPFDIRKRPFEFVIAVKPFLTRLTFDRGLWNDNPALSAKNADAPAVGRETTKIKLGHKMVVLSCPHTILPVIA